jgi:hypothetical protein
LTVAGKFHAVGDVLQRGVVAKLIPFHASTLPAKGPWRNAISRLLSPTHFKLALHEVIEIWGKGAAGLRSQSVGYQHGLDWL